MKFRARLTSMYGPHDIFIEAGEIIDGSLFSQGRFGGSVPLDPRLEPLDDEAREHFARLTRGPAAAHSSQRET